MSGPEDKKIFVLVAEDDEDDSLLIREALAENGLNWELHYVTDGLELMDYLRRCANRDQPGAPPFPDLILLDLNMPRKDGRETLREISANPLFRNIPIAVLTTSSEPDDVRLCRSLGAGTFFTKPSAYSEWVEKMGAVRKIMPDILFSTPVK